MASFDWKKNIEDSLKDGLIIGIGAAGIFYGLKAANVKPPKGIPGCYGYTKTCQWNMWRGIGQRLRSLQEMDQRINTTKNFIAPGGHKINTTPS